MKSTTSTYKQIIASGNTRKFHVTVNLTLADNTQITITEADIMDNSFKLLSASSGTDSFDIGSAIIGKCQFTLMNFDDSWTAYDFFNATAVVWVGMDGDVDENDNQVYYRMGFYTVDEPAFAGSLVSLEMLDNMWKFDVPLDDVNITYDNNTSCREIVSAICSHCGVTLAAPNFHGYNFKITKKPEEDMNCREMLQYIAMIGCNFCIINSSGALDIRWYDTNANPSDELDGGTFSTNTTPYSDGDNADGGNFTNYSSGADYDGGSFIDPNVVYFTRLMSRNIGTDRLEITGVKFVIEDTDYRIGQEGYVLSLENPLVDTSNVNRVLNLIWDVIEDFKIRTFSVTALPDLSPEVGDCVAVSYKGNMVYSYLTNYTFTPSLATASLGAITPTRSLTKRYSKAVKAAVEIARKNTNEIISDYDLAVQRMNNLAINAMGAYQDYEDLSTGGRVYYLSNMPITKDSSGHCSFVTGATVFKMTGDGFFVSTDGGQTWTNGYDAHTGALVVNVLYAIGISAEWIKTGTLDVGGSGTNAVIRVKDSQNIVICTIDTNGITMNKGVLQSADYSYTSGKYADSGMIIDLVNTYMRSTAFYLNNNGGYIGAASFDDTAIKIEGDIVLFSGTGTFTFRPIDYGINSNAIEVAFSVVETYTGTTNVEITAAYDDGSTPPSPQVVGLINNEPNSVDLRTAKEGSSDNYITYTIEVSSRAVKAVLSSEIAYMGVGGFKGVFSGVVNSPQGEIAGASYNPNGFTEGLYFNGIVNGYPAYVYISPTTVLRRFYDPDVGDYVSESAFDQIDDYQPFIAQEIITPVHTANEGTLVFEGIDGDTRKKLWRREGNQWIEIELGANISYGTDEPTGGKDGDAYIQLSSDLKISYVSADQAWAHERFIYDDSKIAGMVISGHGTGGNDIIAYKLTGLIPDAEVTINFTAQITSGSPVYYNTYPNGAYADNAVSTSSSNYVAFTQGTDAHNYSLSFTPSDSVAYFWIQLSDINDSYTITLDITNLTFQGAIGGSGIKALWVNENGTWQSGYFGGSGGDVFVGATASTAGAKGLVPAPSAGDQNKYLRGDGTWHTVSGGGGGSYSETLLWDYINDNNGTIPYNSYTLTLNDSADNYDELLVELASSSGDLTSAQWKATNQVKINMNAIKNAYNQGYINITTYDNRSSRFYVSGTTFQMTISNVGNTNGAIRIYGINY